jgi:hypothetical protein
MKNISYKLVPILIGGFLVWQLVCEDVGAVYDFQYQPHVPEYSYVIPGYEICDSNQATVSGVAPITGSAWRI